MTSKANKISFAVEGQTLRELYRFLNDNSVKLSGELEKLYYNIQNEFYNRLTVAEFEEMISKE